MSAETMKHDAWYRQFIREHNGHSPRCIDAWHAALVQAEAAKVPPSPCGDDATEVDLWAEIWRLREAVKGPPGFETWQDAATYERISRVRAEREMAKVPKGYVLVPKRLTQAMNEVLESADWNWPDLLAAAEAITIKEYAAASQESASPDTACRKCGGAMLPGKAIEQTFRGVPDFPGREVVTVSAGGPGKLIDCLKCSACGWSLSGRASPAEGAA